MSRVSTPSELKGWYTGGSVDDVRVSGIAGKAFQAAAKQFLGSVTHEDTGRLIVTNAVSMLDIHQTVERSKMKYTSQAKHPKVLKWLQRFSSGVHFYSNVLDVFVQHHPEYVSLVWGAIKFIFTGIINHEETTKLMAKSLTQIGECLEGLQLTANLYPTPQITVAVEELYSHILKFLVRAHKWYNEGKLRHIVHSITQPVQLRYKDLLDDIKDASNKLDRIAKAAGQAEQRDMHLTLNGSTASIQEIHTKISGMASKLEGSEAQVDELMSKVVAFHAIQSGALLDTNQRISDIQLSNILTHLSDVPLDDPIKIYQQHLFFKKRRAAGLASTATTNAFWLSPKLKSWSSSPKSTLAVIKGGFTSRKNVQDFCVEVIEQLQNTDVPVLWALNRTNYTTATNDNTSTTTTATSSPFSIIDLLKYLTLQALQLNKTLRTEKTMAWRCAQFQSARTPQEWFNLFQAVINSFGRQVYLVVDLETVDVALRTHDGFNLVSAMMNAVASNDPPSANHPTKQKVLVAMYRASSFGCVTGDVSESAAVVPVKISGQRRQQAKGMRRGVSARVVRGLGRGRGGARR
ncbi:hypothetical protein B0T19DRAFT_150873 [Cercophora scortea]|uniref:DUF7708 domain-containing protein n=1 Tax=Cercophora scortea TaxID=314031 RepID=A0AAE0MCD2_9PEZI|nr:hypothetical protein B0T19DRAFT_150873 [Cercophora scortea]